MDLLFKLSTNIPSKNTVGDTDFEDYYSNVNTKMKFKNLKPSIRKATRTFIAPFIDNATYKLLVDNNNLNAIQSEVRELLCQAVAEYSIYLALAKNITVISDMGAVESTNDNTQPISQWKLKLTRWSCICDGDAAIDQALQLIEENLSEFVAFTVSQEKNDSTSIFFKTTKQFAKYANITGRRAFLALLPHIRKSERAFKKILCSEYLNVVSFLSKENPSTVEKEMIDLCRTYIALDAMLEGIVQISMVYTGDKYRLASNTESYDTRSKTQVTWLGGTEALKMSLTKQLSSITDDLTSFLDDNDDVFLSWKTDNEESEEEKGLYVSDDCVGAVGIM